jgi:hypothetical protein
MGTEIVFGEEKKYFALGRREQLRRNKKSVESGGTTSPTNQPRKGLFHLYSFTSISTVSSLSGGDKSTRKRSGTNSSRLIHSRYFKGREHYWRRGGGVKFLVTENEQAWHTHYDRYQRGKM